MPGLMTHDERDSLAVRPLAASWERSVEDYTTALAFSPDGEALAVATAAGPIALFAAANGELLATFPGHANGTLAIAWSADGSRLASGGQDGLARIVRRSDGSEEAALEGSSEGRTAWVEQVSWGSAWDALAVAAGRSVRLWQAPATLRAELSGLDSTVSALGWRPRSTELAAIAYGGVTFFDPRRGAVLRTFEWRTSLLSLAFSPNGKNLACGCQDSAVHVWEIDAQRDLEMSGYHRKVRELAWSADSTLLATGGGAAITVWRFSGKGPAGSRPQILAGHTEPVAALAFQRHGAYLASAARDGSVLLWHPASGLDLPFAGGLRIDDQAVGIAWSPDDRRLAATFRSGAVVVFDRPGRPFEA